MDSIRQPKKPKAPLSFQSPGGKSSALADIDALVQQTIARVADKWTLLTLEALDQHGTLRFTQLAEQVGGVSQKMLTQTLRQMEADGFVTRTVHPIIPPKVEYTLTPLGRSLGEAFCSVWIWAEKNYKAIEKARTAYRERNPA
ncbi:winged helix-turn-helix transcriptional regulator [Terriglobus tenax]|uniref:winged helix-turn-helix transcriptional regulator n=1 Tax=Terriglobus tenax TaxID=1111115 RepID=UPI0021E04F47|nr:helix-turn-helix domain-containing protein [Terriglobus tenax]